MTKQLIDVPKNRDDVLFNLKVKLKALKKYRRNWMIDWSIKDQIVEILLRIVQQSNHKINIDKISVDEVILTLGVDIHRLILQSFRYHISDVQNSTNMYVFNTKHCIGRIMFINESYSKIDAKYIDGQINKLITDFSKFLRKVKLKSIQYTVQDVYLGYITARELEVLNPNYFVVNYYRQFFGINNEDYYRILEHLINQNGVTNFISDINFDDNLNYGKNVPQLYILNNLIQKAGQIK